MARMPEAKKATLKTTVAAELKAALGIRPDLRVVTVADGARDNWRFLDALAPEATAVVDFYHATEQLKSALDACYGENDPKGRAQFEKLRHVLRDDPNGVDKVIRALSYQRTRYPKRKRIGEVLRYFRHNRHRMRCADIQAHHRERLERVKAIGRELGPATAEAFSQRLFRQRSWGPMAESETYAHLEHLRLAGEAARRSDAADRYVYEAG